MISFRLAATLTGIVCVVLFPILLLVPETYMGTYGVTSDAPADFMSRRASPTLLGLGVLLLFARRLTAPEAQRAIALGVIVTFAGIAATGIYEYARGFAGTPIVVAAVGELIIAAVFVRFLRA